MDFRNVTRLFADPEWDGPIEIDSNYPAKLTKRIHVHFLMTLAPPSTANAPITHSKPVVDKDGCQVMVVNKVVSVYDADGKLLRTESITDYTKKNILDSFATIDTFTSKWKELKKSQTLLIC